MLSLKLGLSLASSNGVGGSDAFLLDVYTGAAVAYSLRKLKSTTTNVIRVRRSSDNAELDFTASEITDGTLTTWTGANDGFVTTWYDQSGNAKNMTSSTATRQPKIVSVGSVLLENGKPILTSDGSTTGMTSSYIADSGVSAKGLFIVTKRSSSPKSTIMGSYSNGNNSVLFLNSASTSTTTSLNVALASQRLNGATWSYSTRTDTYNDLISQSVISLNAVFSFGSDAGDALSLGYRYTSPLDNDMTDMQELIIFENQTDQEGKETAINSFYSAY